LNKGFVVVCKDSPNPHHPGKHMPEQKMNPIV
jgi:hypothetical protein